MAKGRIILHIDMNCYFVSCELAEQPELNNFPVAVAPKSESRKSIILTANYEARKYGVNSAMRVSDALIKCPKLILIDPHMELYADYSHRFFDYFLSITPLVEPASIDEAYLDITDVCRPEDVIKLANEIQQHLLNNLHLPCSIGIAPNKFLAKMASDYKKPLGITVFRKREVEKLLHPIPIEDMQGVGKKTLENMRFLKIKTIGDLATYPDKQILIDIFGPNSAKSLIANANGEGDTVIDTNRFTDFSSISNSQTFDVDLFEPNLILTNLKILVNTVSNRLERHNYNASTFTIQIRYNNFKTVTRSKTIDSPTNDNLLIFNIIKDLFEDYYDERFPVRLLGVGASKLMDVKQQVQQLTIFDNLDKYEKENEIKKLINNINTNFGENTLKKGIAESNKENDRYNKEYLKDLKDIRL